MQAVVERGTRAAAVRRPAPAASMPAPAACALQGVHFLNKHSISYPPQIGVTDVLEVDFDQRHVEHDGTYLIAYPGTNDPLGWPWGGARRFQRMPVSGLHIFEGDEWRPLNDGHQGMVVLGQILHIYRRTK